MVIGAIVGFASAVAIEYFRLRLETKLRKLEREQEAKQLREKIIKDFLEGEDFESSPPVAWLKVMKTESYTPRLRDYDTNDGSQKRDRLFLTLRRILTARNQVRGKYVLGRTQVIGRKDDCEISLSDISVSRIHAMLRYDEGTYIVFDLGSSAGTLVNDEKVPNSGKFLSNGDKISVGKSILLFEENLTEAMKQHREAMRQRRMDGETIVDSEEKT